MTDDDVENDLAPRDGPDPLPADVKGETVNYAQGRSVIIRREKSFNAWICSSIFYDAEDCT